MGDPDGIGPEIIFKCMRAYLPAYPVVIIGNSDSYEDKSVSRIDSIDDISSFEKGVYFYHVEPDSIAGDISFECVRIAVDWALDKKIHAVVTAPICKKNWLDAGISYKGHTDFLAESAGAKNHSMFFWSDNLKVALFTVHIPLKEIFEHLKKDRITVFIKFVAGSLKKMFSKDFTILVSGLNPHSGESGHMGTEEVEEIIPSLEELKADGMNILGPFPPDVVFLKAKEMENAVVISWYHDQGLIPFKLLNINTGVNLTLGLPYVRTSPDHGTAFDIAGKGIANPSSMNEAIRLAENILGRN
ncbi:MAG: 4-hydroxythreonine-4-phosphate dehydrogenase PdxA [bacterium]|nr:4-hydroxythreonine-4-phosphate dehydrogenase PdxA [bacterium]